MPFESATLCRKHDYRQVTIQTVGDSKCSRNPKHATCPSSSISAAAPVEDDAPVRVEAGALDSHRAVPDADQHQVCRDVLELAGATRHHPAVLRLHEKGHSVIISAFLIYASQVWWNVFKLAGVRTTTLPVLCLRARGFQIWLLPAYPG